MEQIFIYGSVIILVIAVCVVVVLCLRVKQLQRFNQFIWLENEQVHVALLMWKHMNKDYTIMNNREAEMFGCPHIINVGTKLFYPVVYFELGKEGVPQAKLVGADEMQMNENGVEFICRLSQEKYDDFLRQIEENY